MRRIFFLCLVLVLSFGLMACGDDVTPEKVEKTGNDSAQGEQVPEAKIETFSIGDTVKMGDLEFTLNEAKWDYGSDFMQPEEGEKWLILDCTIKNTGEKNTALSSLLMFKLVDDQHYSRDMAIFANTKGSLDGELSAGRTMRGEVAFAVEVDSTSFEFIFEPNLFGFGQAIYEFEESAVK